MPKPLPNSRAYEKLGTVISRELDSSRASVSEDGIVSVAFSSETPVDEYWGLPPMVLLHEGRSMKKGRLKAALVDHDTRRIGGAVMAQTIRCDSDNIGRADVKLLEHYPDREALLEQLREGIMGVSVRYTANRKKVIHIKEGKTWRSNSGRVFEGPLLIAREWEPLEISFTAIPADASVGPGRSQEEETMMPPLPEHLLTFLRSKGLPEDADVEAQYAFLDENRNLFDSPPAPKDPPKQDPAPVDNDAALREMRSAETKRLESLRGISKGLKNSNELLTKWVDDGTSVEEATSEALREFKKAHDSDPGGAPHRERTHIETGTDAVDKFRAVANATFAARFGLPADDQSCQIDGKPAEVLPGARCIDIMQEFFRLRGGSNHQFHTVDDFLSPRSFMATQTSDDFKLLQENVITKLADKGFNESRQTYKDWTVSGNLSDFKPASRVLGGELGYFEKLAEGAQIAEDSFGERRVLIECETFAKAITLTRKAMINDDMNEFAKNGTKLGKALDRTINRDVYALLTNPSTTFAEDNLALFAAHVFGTNILAAASIGDTAMDAIRVLMQTMTGLVDPDGDANLADPLNYSPTRLVVPAALSGAARKFVGQEFISQTEATAKDPANRGLKITSEPLLDASSTANWFAMADDQIETIEVARLNGQTAPVLHREEGREVPGMHWTALGDYGMAVRDSRGMVLCGALS